MTSKEAIDRLKRGIDGLDDLGAGSIEWKEEFDAIEQELEWQPIETYKGDWVLVKTKDELPVIANRIIGDKWFNDNLVLIGTDKDIISWKKYE